MKRLDRDKPPDTTELIRLEPQAARKAAKAHRVGSQASPTPAPAPQPTPPQHQMLLSEQKKTHAGLDRRTSDRLRRGQLPIEATLDLHGMTQTRAYESLVRFIQSSRRGGLRCVLVITGRGSPDQADGRGVLRRMLPHWLKQPVFGDGILSLAQARQQHGGSGAFYVLLRRPR